MLYVSQVTRDIIGLYIYLQTCSFSSAFTGNVACYSLVKAENCTVGWNG